MFCAQNGDAAPTEGRETLQEKKFSKYTIVAAAFAAFLATFNETFLNVGFTPIGADLGVEIDTVQWLATAYMLAAAVMVPIAAFAYRTFKTRPLYCFTVCFLIVGSAIGFLAPNFEVLLAGRVVQAIGTGMLIPLNMSITLDTAPREKLGTYMGIMGSMTTLGPSLSVILAGVLLSFFSWRVLLLVFGLLSAACLVVGFVILRDVADITKPRLDVLSVILVGLGLVFLLYGISTVFGGNLVSALGGIVVGAALLVVFGWRQGKLETPLVDLRPLKIPAFTIGVLLNMIALIIMFAMNIITPTFMQSVLGADSLTASLTLFPAILLSSVVSPLAGRIYDKTGPRVLLPAGFLCITVFSILLAVFITTGNVILLALLYIPIICGCALVIGPVQSFALSRLSWELNPHGTTVMSVGFQVAGALGSSLFTGVYYLGISNGMASGMDLAAAGGSGFLMAGIMAACFGVVAIILSVVEGNLSKRPSAAQQDQAAWAESQAAEGETAGGIVSPVHAPGFALGKVMKRDVFSINAGATVLEALAFFQEKGISGAPVVDDAGNLAGIVTDGDIMRNLANQHTSFKTAYSFILEKENGFSDERLKALVNRPVGEIASPRVISVETTTSLGDLCELMSEHHFNKMPVTENGKMVGMVNRSDVTRFIVSEYLGAMA